MYSTIQYVHIHIQSSVGKELIFIFSGGGGGGSESILIKTQRSVPLVQLIHAQAYGQSRTLLHAFKNISFIDHHTL